MAQAFCSRPLTAEARVRARVILCEICEQSCTGTGFFRVLWFPPSVSFHSGSSYTYFWEMKNRPVGVRSSETSSHPITMNNMNMSM
jgi:hypothetical protein